MSGRVRKVFTIQEQRKKQYLRLEKAGSEYCSEHWTEEQYQIEVKEVTALFSRLSSELLSTIPWFRDNGQSEAATILDALQLREKEKLHLTVQYQVKRLEVRDSERNGKVEGTGGEEFSTTAHELKMLRRKLAEVEGAIAGLLDDLRFECEPLLLGDR